MPPSRTLEPKTPTEITRLPRELIDRVRKPFSQFLRIEAAAGAVLLVFTLAALAIANSPWASGFDHFWETSIGVQFGSFQVGRSLREWINDGLMTLFFFLVAVELKRQLTLGELNSLRMAALSIVAAAGGMIVPAAFYLSMQWNLPGEMGWGTVVATDTAFVIGCLALLGARIPHSLRVFMLSLAIADDVGAILVLAVGYSRDLAWGVLALAALGVGIVRILARLGVRGFPLYFVAGIFTWLAFDSSGIHPTITGVILGLMTPVRRWVSEDRLHAILVQVVAHPSDHAGSGPTPDRHTLQMAEIAARESLSPAERLDIALHPWVAFAIMPIFAFANAGLPLAEGDITDSVTIAVFVGFAFGKPIGILTFCWLALRAGIATRPADLTWGLLMGGSLLAGIGFTMALFIANLAFSSTIINNAKLGILVASAFSAIAGLVVLFAISSRHKPSVSDRS